jgi:HPt (histidine-containing phosphotransfer) domain-containing protein
VKAHLQLSDNARRERSTHPACRGSQVATEASGESLSNGNGNSTMTSSERHGGDAISWTLNAEMREIAEMDPSLIPELISMFLDDSNTRLLKLRDACSRQDFKTIRAQAHSLKGSSLQMSAPALASLCASLEAAHNPRPDECDPILGAIGEQFVLVRSAMEKYVAETKVA